MCTSQTGFDSQGEFKMSLGGRKGDREEFTFDKPSGITVDTHGHLFMCDTYKGRVLMYK